MPPVGSSTPIARITPAGVALLLALVLAACASGGAPAGGRTSPTAAPATPASPAAKPAGGQTAPATARDAAPPAKRIQLGMLPTVSQAPFLIAEKRGYFAAEGLAVELVPFDSGAAMVAPLGTGQLDAGGSAAASAGLVNAIARGVRVRIVASTGTALPDRNTGGIVFSKLLAEGGVRTLGDLAGRRVRAAVTAEGSVQHATLMIAADEAGLPRSNLDVTFMGLPDMNVALANGALDVASHGEPLLTVGEQQGLLVRWKGLGEILPDLATSALLYGTNLLDRDQDAGQRLMVAFLRGVRDYENAFSRGADHAEIVALLAEPLRLSPDLFETLQGRGALHYFDPNGTVAPAPLARVLDTWASLNLVQQRVDVGSLLEPAFADAALSRIGNY